MTHEPLRARGTECATERRFFHAVCCGLVPAVFNAANEQAVAAFLAGKLRFTDIPHILSGILEESDHVRGEPTGIPDVLSAEHWARARADELIAGTR